MRHSVWLRIISYSTVIVGKYHHDLVIPCSMLHHPKKGAKPPAHQLHYSALSSLSNPFLRPLDGLFQFPCVNASLSSPLSHPIPSLSLPPPTTFFLRISELTDATLPNQPHAAVLRTNTSALIYPLRSPLLTQAPDLPDFFRLRTNVVRGKC